MNANELIGSGTLELYVLGMLSVEENRAIEAEAVHSPELRAEIDALQALLEMTAMEGGMPAPSGLKAKAITVIEEVERQRISDGRPPVLHPASKVSDYTRWINDPAITRPADAGDLLIVPIDQRDGEGTAVLWLTLGAPEETHTDEIEKFLILEGTCDIHMAGAVHQLVPGSYLSIPLHVPHTIVVTSRTPCKILLQRIAA